MPKRKMLKANGSSIKSYSVDIIKVKSENSEKMIDVINLTITTEDGNFNYHINKDTREPDLQQICKHINESLRKAKEDCLNVEVSEYPERFYLFFEIQRNGQKQYTGRRK